MVFTKEIKIGAKDLGPKGKKEILHIVLVFHEDSFFPVKKPNPVVWKVAPFTIGEQGYQSIEATFVSKYKVCKAEVDSDKVVQVSTISESIQVGEQIDLVNDPNSEFKNLASYTLQKEFVVNNHIEEPVTIGAGFYDYSNKFSPLAVWQGVPSNERVYIEFTPTLSIFFTTHPYKEGEIFSEFIPPLGMYNLADPSVPSFLHLDLTWDKDEERYVLSKA